MLLDHGDPAMEIPEDAQKHSPQIRWAVGVVCNVWREFSIIPYPFEHAEFCTKRCLDHYFVARACRGRAAHEFERVD